MRVRSFRSSLLYFFVASLNFSKVAIADEALSSRSLDPDAILDPASFLTRTYHSSIVVGNFLYIDGGHVAFVSDGLNHSLPANSTYSLDLSASWTNESVRLNRIDKGLFPMLNMQNLWLDSTGTFFYAYNGDIPGVIPLEWQQQPPPSQLLKFTPDGNSGTWEQVTSSPIDRVTAALNAYGNGFGYAVGGWKSSHTEQGLGPMLPAPGLVSYDMTSGNWLNVSGPELGNYGTLWDGVAQFLPDFADEGLLLVMSGTTSQNPGIMPTLELVSFHNVSLYNPKTDTWKYQSTTGTIPEPRWRTCSVVAMGDNGTVEIFMYAGNADTVLPQLAPSNQNVQLDAVYVLSLPSFKWSRTNYTPAHARSSHTCNLAGSNSRQMIAVGGFMFADSSALLIPDVWTQGLGVFDLTEMVWKDRYDVDAAPYVTPQMIKEDYAQNGRFPKDGWDDPTVENWFMSTAASQPQSTNAPTPSPKSDLSGCNDVCAIASGVLGGVLGSLLFAILLWWFRRRSSRRTQAEQHNNGDDFRKPELPSASATRRHELEAGSRIELDGAGKGTPT